MALVAHSRHRMVHPVAWWAWGIGLAAAASHTTNPILLVLIVVIAAWVVVERRELGAIDAFVPFLLIGLGAIAFRVVMTVVFGNGIPGGTIILDLPSVRLPSWVAGIRLGGPVSLEGVVAAAAEGARLATTLACLGAANALASPKRLLRYAPATLYDIGTAVVVALTFAPQLVELAGRVRTARQLRGHSGRGLREVARIIVPVLSGTLDRSLDLAASMESRGYGRVPALSRRQRTGASSLALVGAAGVVAGLFGVMSPSIGGVFGLPTLVLGVLVSAGALMVGARTDTRTAYRRDPWRSPEWILSAMGAAVALSFLLAESRGIPGMALAQVPLAWPELPWVPAAILAACALAIPATPLPPRLAARRRGLTHVSPPQGEVS
ncbi:MAG: energy-coupling factor transporter transmembrane protein EcfT [Actinomycetales bacterium]|nr:energy-coupling factor transporter transmembrane protein EcfT [Actinomycetales bacterium]